MVGHVGGGTVYDFKICHQAMTLRHVRKVEDGIGGRWDYPSYDFEICVKL